MQTIQQTFAAPTTWELNIGGQYFTTLACGYPVNVRFYKGGQLLDLGNIQGLLAGLEVSNINFDRVQIDVTAADTVMVGIGNGNARYNRQNAAVAVSSNVQPKTGSFTNGAATVTNASAILVPLNLARQYLLIQNNGTGDVYLSFGVAATVAAGIKVLPGGSYEMPTTQTTQNIHAIGSIASNANIVVVEG